MVLEALIVTLREGVEAALVVGIIVAFLRRQDGGRYLPAVWAGLGAAAAASVAGAFALYRWALNQEAFEGVLYLASALIVGTLVVWMWRHAGAVAGEVRGSLARILGREHPGAAAAGIFAFTFLMVFREGVETVLFLSAVSLSTGGLLVVFGAAVGLAAAVAFGVLFVRGSLRIDLGRFFAVTSIALLAFVTQLLLNGYHELSEAGWLPASAATMAVVGPLVRSEAFFLAAILALPLLLLLVPGGTPEGAAANPAAARLARARQRRQRRARSLGGSLGIAIVAALGLGFSYSRRPAELPPATPLEAPPGGEVRIPVERLEGGTLQRFAVRLEGRQVRFVAIALGDGEVGTAFDACLLCGPRGYYQQGAEVLCYHCGSAIHPPTIGQPGGCNPLPLPSRLEGGELVIRVADLAAGAGSFR